MIAFVTGGTGFVGSHLVTALQDAGYTVRCLVRDVAKLEKVFGPRAGRIERVPGDLGDSATLVRACAGTSVVFHVAGLVAAATPDEFQHVNADAAGRVADAAQRSGTGRLVFVSSQAAAGPSTHHRPTVETDEPAPVTDYGRSKLAGEAAVKASGATWTIVRPPTVYGPRDTELLRVFKLARSGVVPVFGNGSQALSLVYAGDLAKALVAAADAKCAGRTYFACHRQVVTSRQLVTAIYNAVGGKGSPTIVPVPQVIAKAALWLTGTAASITGSATVLSPDKANEFFAEAWTCSPAALEQDTGWKASYDVIRGTAETAAWYKTSGWM